MSLGLVAIGLAVGAGAVLAVSARDGRVAVLGLALALVGTPLVVATPPMVLPLAARLAAAILAVYLLWIALRPATGRTLGSRLGWPVESLAALAAAVVGWAGAGLGGELLGARESVAAAFALGILAIGPLLLRDDPLQVGIGLALGLCAAELLRAGLAGAPSPFEHLVLSGLFVALGGAVGLLTGATLRANGSLDLAVHPAGGAHPVEPATGAPARKRPRLRARVRPGR